MPSAAHVPRRTCIGCRTVRPQVDLARLGLDADGRPYVGAGDGRGAWLCGPECAATAVRRHAFARAWRRPVDTDTSAAVVELLTRAMQDGDHPGTLSGGLTNERRLRTTKG